MAIKYLDFEGGNDTLDGTTFANRWKTITSGATAARTAAGDIIRVMGSPDPTLVGNATWTQYSKSVTLASSVTQMICDCEAAWTASTNVTTTANTGTFKEGTKSARLVIAAAFTTGKLAYFATGSLNLSGYQQVSFFIFNDAAIQSVALYQDVDIAAVNIQLDNIIACKASASADSLTLTSLIGKVCNLSWAASTAYALNDSRKPTQANRNGFRYTVMTAGTTGSTEPTWPQEIGATVTDGSVVWQCSALEDTWFGIQSINGVTVKLDNNIATLGNAGRGYGGTTETTPTYKRETIKTTMAAATGTVVQQVVATAGTDGNPTTFLGGWNRTDMSTQTGETWLDGGIGNGYAIDCNNKNFVSLNNVNGVRYYVGVEQPNIGASIANSHWNNCTNLGLLPINSVAVGAMTGISCCNNGVTGISFASVIPATLRQVTLDSNLSNGVTGLSNRMALKMLNWTARNNGSYGVVAGISDITLNNGITGNNGSGAVNCNGNYRSYLNNCLLPEATPFAALTAYADAYVFSQKHGQTTDNHLITTDGGTILSATDQRHTASGISWKFRPTATSRSSAYPLRLSVAKVAVTANSLVTMSIWTRRDNTAIVGRLKVVGGQIAGVGADLIVACAPAINTWTQSASLTFTPTEAGVVEVTFECYDGVGTTNNMWIDDFAVTQA